MLKSMTAYGRATHRSKVGHFVAEIQSVNRKFLEINVILPRELMRFDGELKKWLQPFVSRGQVTLKIAISFEEVAPVIVQANIPLARQMKQAWEHIANQLEIEDKFSLSLLAGVEDILLFEENLQEEEAYRSSLKHVLDLALASFSQMKANEGMVLQLDILDRIQKIRTWFATIEKRTPYATQKYREKLQTRLEEVLPGNVENEERILREIALFAEKIDITEEITRFQCHLVHLETLIQSDQISVGKTLEFVIQELNREINTIGSKSSDIEIARLVIDVKSELERIREQVQNVE